MAWMENGIRELLRTAILSRKSHCGSLAPGLRAPDWAPWRQFGRIAWRECVCSPLRVCECEHTALLSTSPADQTDPQLTPIGQSGSCNAFWLAEELAHIYSALTLKHPRREWKDINDPLKSHWQLKYELRMKKVGLTKRGLNAQNYHLNTRLNVFTEQKIMAAP